MAAPKLGYLPRGSFLDSNHTGLRSQKKKICLHIYVGCNESQDAADNFENMNHRASELTTVLYVFMLFRKGCNMVTKNSTNHEGRKAFVSKLVLS